MRSYSIHLTRFLRLYPVYMADLGDYPLFSNFSCFFRRLDI